jgi:hypothetical protein
LPPAAGVVFRGTGGFFMPVQKREVTTVLVLTPLLNALLRLIVGLFIDFFSFELVFN